MVRVVVVEDSPTQLALCRDAVACGPGLRLVGAFTTAEDAMASVAWAEVDVLLTDLELPGASGVTLIIEARRANPRLLALPLTVHDDTEVLYSALEAGAMGYLLKGLEPSEIAAAIVELVGGRSPISPAIGRHLISAFQRPKTDACPQELSPRETQVLRGIAAGQSYKEIAATLGISAHTVNAHLKNIYAKLHATGRAEALRKARLLGYPGMQTQA